MEENYSLRDDGSFVITNYNSVNPFSNFLPGVAGAWGVPMWAFYVNRGQCLAGFGINDKEHAISEYFPANKAYSFTPYLGFRTFLKTKNKFYEPFTVKPSGGEKLSVKSASFSIEDTNDELGIKTQVKYFTLCNTRIPALVRVVTLKNTSREALEVEVMDGLAVIVPFGMINFFLKEMSRTIEAWMRVEDCCGASIFKLIVDPADVSKTEYVTGGNFNYSFYEENGQKVSPCAVVDPQMVFGQDTTYALPHEFLKNDFTATCSQMRSGKTPCSFSHFKWQLAPGEEKVFYSTIGSAFSLDALRKFLPLVSAQFLSDKEKENEALIEGIKENVAASTSLKRFDDYLKCTYLDNVLRGGLACRFSEGNFYYIFSRKHGDLERDYNRFKILPSYFSEGEANYRDINQNRRVDWFFNPTIGTKNIEYFLSLLKIDSYNPLTVKGDKLYFEEKEAAKFLKDFSIKSKAFSALLVKGFYLGEALKALEDEGVELKGREAFAAALSARAKREPAASFGEGCWIDHWHYNLDLIESYLYFYPEKRFELFTAKKYLFWDDEHRVRPRSLRYSLKDGAIFQYSSVEAVKEKREIIGKRKNFHNFLHTKSGKLYGTTLSEKLLSVILNRLATLDPEGIGIEMEADKPGWCDSLNGLPALFGSSLCETLELKRACFLLLSGIKEMKAKSLRSASLCTEVFTFFTGLSRLLDKDPGNYDFWNTANTLKEKFRALTFESLSGMTKEVSLDILEKFLNKAIKKLDRGIKKAVCKKTGVPITYFRYNVTRYLSKGKAVWPAAFKRHDLPLFLEGAVYAFKAGGDKALYKKVRLSPLFDKELGMYRLNASLANEPLDIGRSRIFLPGWLENESIWLHMEYKYLLEVLKSGLYEEFYSDFKKACVCFFDPERYGRSILENSSFIVSSAYPYKELWGKGFAARLSGATVEALNIWELMALGKEPFYLDEKDELCLRFAPLLKKEMFTAGEKTLAFKLFSSTRVVYHNPSCKNTYEDCHAQKIVVALNDERIVIQGDTVKSPLAQIIRCGEASHIDVYFD
jgi:hypothetical protein